MKDTVALKYSNNISVSKNTRASQKRLDTKDWRDGSHPKPAKAKWESVKCGCTGMKQNHIV